MSAYQLILTAEEASAVEFVGRRYDWSAALCAMLYYDDDGEPEPIKLAEHEAWTLSEAFERDTEGGHSFFPMLDGRSTLAGKLHAFRESIV
jgi:hypothetical protein